MCGSVDRDRVLFDLALHLADHVHLIALFFILLVLCIKLAINYLAIETHSHDTWSNVCRFVNGLQVI